MTKLKATFCFLEGTFSGKDTYNQFVQNLWFKPESILLPKRKYTDQKYTKKHIDEIKSKDTSISLWLKEESGVNSFQVTEVAHRNFHQVIYATFLITDYDKVLKIFENHINTENFIVGYCHDEFDKLLQNASNDTDFRFLKIEKPKTNLIENDWGDMIVNIEKNPGRKTLVSNMWITVTWRMWFGKKFYEYVSKELLKSFKCANTIMEIGEDSLFIELYEDYSKADLSENRARQQAFRDYIKMEQLIINLK